jgi:RimJ/RimL family protein N-acetyltransferase
MMAFHRGQAYWDGNVSIAAPDGELSGGLPKAPDVIDSVEYWLKCAPLQDDIYYFWIYWQQTPVGQIFLHDINRCTGESLIGYHLFEPKYRGQGIGTKALGLLQQFVVSETNLAKLVIITGRDNLASQRIATRCGFQKTGGAREEPENLVVFEWGIPRSQQRES